MDKITRLKQHFKDEKTYNNLISIYKELKGKENLKFRQFLNAIVICCLNAQKENRKTLKWQTPDSYFSPNGVRSPYYSDTFDVEALKAKYYNQIKNEWNKPIFGQYPKIHMKHLI